MKKYRVWLIDSVEKGGKSFDQYYNNDIEHNLEKIISQAHTKKII